MNAALPPIWRQTPDKLWPDVEPILLGVRRVAHEVPWMEVSVRMLNDRAELRVDVHHDGDAGVDAVVRLLGGPLRTVGMRQAPDRWLDCGPDRRRHCAEHRGIFHRLEVSVRRLGAVHATPTPEARLPPAALPSAAESLARQAYGGEPADRPYGLGS